MGLNKYKLGELIELVEETNSDQLFGPNDVRGISNLKEMMSTKANLNGRDLSRFQIVRPGIFVFNHRTSRNGSKFSAGQTSIISGSLRERTETTLLCQNYIAAWASTKLNETIGRWCQANTLSSLTMIWR